MLINRMQKLIFNFLIFTIFTFLVIQEIYDLIDSALLLYGLIAVMGYIILGYWIYWYRISEERSTIFIINGLLILSISLVMTIQFFGRYTFVYHKHMYELIIKSDWWSYRVTPEFLVFIWLLSWIISRMYGKQKTEENDKSCFNGITDENKLNVLSIDDDPSITNLIRSQLGVLDRYNIFTANTIEMGLECFRERRYFLIFLDLKFFDDFTKSRELAKIMREEDKYVWITVLTGYVENALNQELLEFVDDIIIKPLSFQDLRAYLILWNLKYRRRMYYLKNLDKRLDCYGEKLKDLYFIAKNGAKEDGEPC
jgi:CheY-like chemotaxis protein